MEGDIHKSGTYQSKGLFKTNNLRVKKAQSKKGQSTIYI